MRLGAAVLFGLLVCLMGGCAQTGEAWRAGGGEWQAAVEPSDAAARPGGRPLAWGEPLVEPASLPIPHAVAEGEGPYLLDTGDRLRIFVYGQPNLSRLYLVDHAGRVSIPLIGNIVARGRTTYALERIIRDRLATEFVKDPQVTVDVQQNRPFFILGEVRAAGQYPYVSGMTIEQAVAIAGGYSERANERRARVTRRTDGRIDVIEAPSDYVLQPGDSVYVYERFF